MKTELAVFGGGCFWCTEAIFERLTGVESVKPGYSGGDVVEPTYEQVSSGRTGHAEAIQIGFNPSQIAYKDLLNVFFATHDPTTPNQQGSDIGPQYRSSIFYTNPKQKEEAERFIEQLGAEDIYGVPIVTEVAPFKAFYDAEDYHQRYYERNKDKSYCQLVINPKIAKLRAKFASLLKSNKDI